MQKASANDIDALLPQTQCGLCGFNGCKPYAEALATGNAEINLCPPGGVKTLQALGSLLSKDATPYVAEMRSKAKPASVAFIREAECIGCTKCIQACPVDAIMGAAKLMHTVLISECTGCDLCVPACPVDCIDMRAAEEPLTDKRDYFRARHEAHQLRLKHENIAKQQSPLPTNDKKSYLAAALARAKAKKL